MTWTADADGGLAPHEFSEFELSVGPFPDDVDQLGLPATQTYSDGEVVAWDEPTEAGGEEPEHPAPVLDLGASTGDNRTSSDDGDDTAARVLGGAGLVVALIALAWTALGRRRRRAA